MGTSPRSVSEGFMYVLILAQRMESVIKGPNCKSCWVVKVKTIPGLLKMTTILSS